MAINSRLSEASKAAGWHLLFSAAFALASAAVVLGIWYPFPYRELSGGRELFLLIIGVDVVCGPLMTLILFNPRKPRRELWLDLGLVALLQLAALSYGTWTAWQARPMYLALEKDRFKVVMSADLRKSDLEKLPSDLAPLLFGGVKVVALRPPNSTEERNKVLFESIETGRDYAERPEFYIAYKGTAALNSLALAKPLDGFFKRYPDQQAVAIGIAKNNTEELNDWKYLPVLGRQDWVALLDKEGAIRGFLKGDGF